MDKKEIKSTLQKHLEYVVNKIGSRPTGSKNNVLVSEYIANELKNLNIKTNKMKFTCIDFVPKKVVLRLNNEKLNAYINPFSSPYLKENQNFIILKTFDELKNTNDLKGKIVILTGEISKDQYFPRNYPFYQDEYQSNIIEILESKNPDALICVSHSNEFIEPIFNDADFKIPGVTIPLDDGKKLINNPNAVLSLKIESQNNATYSYNVIGKITAKSKHKIVLCAHLDTSFDTPGAIDNASGIATLLTIAKLIKNQNKISHNIELVFFNGEDYYSAAGQVKYLQNANLENIKLAINLDGIGLKNSKTHTSYYYNKSKPLLIEKFQNLINKNASFIEGEPWPMSDHMVFYMNGIPAIAITDEQLLKEAFSPDADKITHSKNDTLDKIDYESLTHTAQLLHEYLKII